MFKIEGLDKLQKNLGEIEEAFSELDGKLGSVSFDPENPESIDQAISEVSQMVDKRLAKYDGNETVRAMAEEIKQEYRNSILEKAAAARLEGGE